MLDEGAVGVGGGDDGVGGGGGEEVNNVEEGEREEGATELLICGPPPGPTPGAGIDDVDVGDDVVVDCGSLGIDTASSAAMELGARSIELASCPDTMLSSTMHRRRAVVWMFIVGMTGKVTAHR